MIHPTVLEQSRKLRKNLTPHERKPWFLLRDRRFAGIKFRRQFVIGPYIVDFCCYEKRLIIELDGGGHSDPIQEKWDRERNHYLEEKGFTILRFWNHDLVKNQEIVLDQILGHLKSPLTPTLSPRRGGI